MNNLLKWQHNAQIKLKEKGLASNDVNLIFEKVYGFEYQTKLLLGDLTYQAELDDILTEVLELKKPLAYLVGFEYFYGRKFKVNQNVLIPRIETENLIYESISKIKEQFPKGSKLRILDMCTGSGIIGITTYLELEEDYEIDLVMSDISVEAIKVATENAQKHQVPTNIIESDLFTNIEGTFDVILSNPPYVPYDQVMGMMVKENEPHLALYADDDGLALYKQISGEISEYLKEEFLVCFEIGDGQAQALKELYLNKYANIEIVCDLFGRERNVLIWE